MGFFGFIETFFFISLAITFILIMLLVYHFKQRLSDVETKTDTMFEIMNNLLKEMKTIKTMVIENQQQSIPVRQTPYEEFQGQPGNIFDMMMPFLQGSKMESMNFNGDQDENNEEELVSPIKIINLDTENTNDIDIEDIETINEEFSEEEPDEESDERFSGEEQDETDKIQKPLETIDYKGLDINQLRALAIERGIDPIKKKKGELIQLLQ